MKSSSDLHYSNCKEHYVFLPNIDSCVVRVCTMCLPCQIIKMNIQKNRLLIAEFCERKWKIQPVHVLGITLGKLSINELVSSSIWQPTPVLLPGKSLGRRSLVGCSPWVAKSRTGLSDLTSLRLFTFMHWRRKWQPTPVFFPGESQGRGSLVGFHLWGHTESDMTEAT